jgi:hypothetical protein
MSPGRSLTVINAGPAPTNMFRFHSGGAHACARWRRSTMAPRLLEAAEWHQLEGISAKTSPYRSGVSRDWRKRRHGARRTRNGGGCLTNGTLDSLPPTPTCCRLVQRASRWLRATGYAINTQSRVELSSNERGAVARAATYRARRCQKSAATSGQCCLVTGRARTAHNR